MMFFFYFVKSVKYCVCQCFNKELLTYLLTCGPQDIDTSELPIGQSTATELCRFIAKATNNNNNNNNNNTNICKAHVVSIRAESEAPAVARWREWLEG